MRLTSRRKRSAIVVILFHDFAIDDAIFPASLLSTSARIFSVVSNTVLAAAAEHERHMIAERTRHALGRRQGARRPARQPEAYRDAAWREFSPSQYL
jgi:DNA invertase Pin-like site-specific DNA recombinase